jgi:NAD(P)H-nitrite reductase large subunit
MKKINYLIIGNSAAGINAAESIRQIDKKGSIAIVSEESCPAYSRPLISYFLGNKVSADGMYYKNESFYKENDIELLLNEKAVRIDVKNKAVELSPRQPKNSGTKLYFEKLLIAVGGKSIIPPGTKKEQSPSRSQSQVQSNGIFTFLSWSDTKNIQNFIKKNNVKNVVVVGGGLIGLKATEGLLDIGIKVTIIELADKILSSTFDMNASRVIENALKKTGCNIVTGTTVEKISYNKSSGKNKKVEKVILKNGKVIKTDMVITAIGVIPNIDIIRNTGIKAEKGILTDEYLQTNIPDIYAAGDVAQIYDIILEKTRTIAIWPNASRQGKIAGFNMAGIKKTYEGSFAMNSMEICGIPTISMGLTEPPDDTYKILSEYDKNSGTYRKIVLKDNVIVGAIFINKIDRTGIFAGLIKNKTNTESFGDALLNENFGLIYLPKEYRKHLVTGPGIEI